MPAPPPVLPLPFPPLAINVTPAGTNRTTVALSATDIPLPPAVELLNVSDLETTYVFPSVIVYPEVEPDVSLTTEASSGAATANAVNVATNAILWVFI